MAAYEEFDEEYEEDLVDEWIGRIGHRVRPWQRELNHVADAYLGLAEAFAVPLDQYQRAESGLRGTLRREQGGHGRQHLRAARRQRRGHCAARPCSPRSCAAGPFLNPAMSREVVAGSLKNPYTLAPFEWDAERRAVIYEGPEKHKFGAARYVY